MSRRRLPAIVISIAIVLVAAASIFGLRSPRAAPERPADFGQRAVFIGDSYTHGTGASSPGLRWTSLVAAQRGWQETNLGLGGTGYLATSGVQGCGRPTCPNYGQVVDQAVAAEPDVVVVAGGQNDFPTFEAHPQRVVEAVGRTFADLRDELPGARVIVVGPSTSGQVNETVRAFDAAVESAAQAHGVTYISLMRPTPAILPGMVLEDGAHVNDEGHRAIADRVLDALQ
jgi:lysophospholipase L1-like esterase